MAAPGVLPCPTRDAPAPPSTTSTAAIPVPAPSSSAQCSSPAVPIEASPSSYQTIASISSLSSSPHHLPTDISNSPIPEESEVDETESDSPNEPVTPVSGRQSRDFHHFDQNNSYTHHGLAIAIPEHPLNIAVHGDLESQRIDSTPKPPLILQTTATPPPTQPLRTHSLPQTQTQTQIINSNKSLSAATATPTPTQTPTANSSPIPDTPPTDADRPQTSSSRRFPRRASSGLQLNRLASFFKRTNSNVEKQSVMEFREPNYNSGSSDTTLPVNGARPTASNSRRFSANRSSVTTRSNTPPSPGSPLGMSASGGAPASIPSSNDFFDDHKKNRASTGFSLRGRAVNFVSNRTTAQRRARSVERKKKAAAPESDLTRQPLTREPWAMPPEAGTGMKARRLSLSLPDDFTVDVADLQKEFEYQHKLFGRHGKHLGKGATSKVTLMVRKGCPGELYAVKEFRGKNSQESADDYEKKVKSEYSIAKSLHHPNIVETIRLCSDHGRWNHVMEYCSEGDLFSLVQKGYLKEEGREMDRQCLFKQLCQGINYLHSNGIAHRDIKLENLLVTKDSKIKITDFGVSEVFSGIHPGLREAGGQCGKGMGEIRLCKPGICGSEPYIAPEVLSKRGDYDPRPLDVWSSAIVMVHLVFGGQIWTRAEKGQVHYDSLLKGWEKFNAKKADNPDLPDTAYPVCKAFDLCVKPPPLRRLLLNMLNPDPVKRISMADVVQSRWLKNVECCQLESYEDPTRLIDASKKNCTQLGAGKIFCHNHLPPKSQGHALPPMPGKAGY